ncbi:PAS domain-containing sensor histidine kinase [Telluribacter humicola]|uniref:PAS domain-containing sensor histidine kinase n=1 Tax=Telluribacter humicola TaxID=1720261 RepID=UPI001A966857|nr:ATP-binding protein [Telluribacter humicola]
MAVFRATDCQAEFVNEKYRETFGEKPTGSNQYPHPDLVSGKLFEMNVNQVVGSGQVLVLDNQPLPIKSDSKHEVGYFQLTFQPLMGAASGVESVLLMATELKSCMPDNGHAAEPMGTSHQASLAWTDTLAQSNPENLMVLQVGQNADIRLQNAEAGSVMQPTQLQDILEGALSAMLVCEPVRTAQGEIRDFRIGMANQEASAITGYPDYHLPQSTLLGLFPDFQKIDIPSVGGTVFEELCEIVNTGTPLQDEVFAQMSRHEERRWYKIRASRLDERILLSFNDITESRQATQTVEQQAEFIQCIFDLIPSGIAHLQPVQDSKGRVTDFVVKQVSKASLRQIGIDPENATDKFLSTLLPDYRKTAIFGAFQQVMYFTPFIQGEFVYTYKGKNRAWINMAASKYGDGLIVSFDNVTEAKRNEQHIKDSEERLQTIIDTVQISVGLLSPLYNEKNELVDFWFRTANQAYAAALGQPRTDIINTKLSQWIPGYLSNGLFEAYRDVYLTGEGRQFDFHYHNDGFDDWVDVKATKISDFLLITGTNYTRLKQVQLQAEELVEDLRKSNNNLEKFAYVASHDLQEPLRKIQAFGEILQKKHATSLDESGVDLIRRMQKSADRMQTLITDLLTYSRVSSNRTRTQVIDLNRLVNDLLVDFDTVIQEKNAVVQVEELPVITGELTQLRQLFQNLLSNSLKFTSQERQLRIEISSKKVTGRTTGGIVPSSEADKSFAQIEIRDNGIGFDPKYTERIFQVFQRLHGRSEYPGTGIGLAIVQKVIENHKGYLTAEGRPNAGATFRLLLPL